MLNPQMINILRCPITGQALTESEDGLWLVCVDKQYRYPIEQGIALLLAEHAQAFDTPASSAIETHLPHEH